MKRWTMLMLAVVLAFSACARSQEDSSIGHPLKAVRQSKSAGLGSAEGKGSSSDESLSVVGGPAQAPESLPEIPSKPSRVIRNATIELEVGKGEFNRKFSAASAVAESVGGYVTRSSSDSDRGRISSGDIVIRVPSNRFQAAVTALQRLGKVRSEQRSGDDVTKQFVDLEARLRHAKTQEAFYLRLLDQSKSISDLVQVQGQLSQVQLQIEQIQGELNFLKEQSDFSTISVHMFEPGLAPGSKPKGIAKAWHEALDGFRNIIAGMIVVTGNVLPFALLGLIGYGVWRRVRRSRRPLPTPST